MMRVKVKKSILNSIEYRGATAIVRRLREAGFEAYVVGGAPRDLVLGARPADYDIATDAPPQRVRALFEKTVPVGEQFGVILVLWEDAAYEVATFRSDGVYLDGRRPVDVHFSSAREDVLRRDFTINALMFDPVEQKIIDYVKGRRDIRERRIRTVGEPRERFQEDHLRLIRAVRFATALGFRIERRTRSALVEMAPLIKRVAAERVATELIRILTGPRAGRGLALLSETGLLTHILPEVEAMRGVEQPPNFHPEGDVFTHTCLMLDRAEDPSPTLALGLLLHDVAKPVTQRFTAERIRFDGHCERGAQMAAKICRRLKLSRSTVERVVYLVANHLKIKDAPEMRPARLKRFMREEGFTELLELFRLDTMSSHRDFEAYDWCKAALETLSQEQLAPPPLLTGHDLIAMGYEPGPRFGEMLDALETAQLEGEVSTPEEARKWIRERFGR